VGAMGQMSVWVQHTQTTEGENHSAVEELCSEFDACVKKKAGNYATESDTLTHDN